MPRAATRGKWPRTTRAWWKLFSTWRTPAVPADHDPALYPGAILGAFRRSGFAFDGRDADWRWEGKHARRGGVSLCGDRVATRIRPLPRRIPGCDAAFGLCDWLPDGLFRG